MGSATLLGAWHGGWLPATLGRVDAEGAQGGVMLGAGLGALVGYGVSALVDVEPWHNLEMLAGSAVGNLIGAGLGLIATDTLPDRALALQIGGGLGLGLTAALAPFTDYEEAAALLVGASLWGASQGSLLAFTLEPQPGVERISGGGLLGAGLGLAAGMVGSQFARFETADVVETSIMLGAGDLIGAGLGLLTSQPNQVTAGLFQGAGLLGLGAGLVASKYTEYTGSDYGLITFATLAGAHHGLLLDGIITPAHGELSVERSAGGAMLGAGVGLGVGLGLSQVLQMEGLDILEMSLLTLIGDAAGLGVGLAADLDRPGVMAAVQAGGLGLAALGLAASHLTDFDHADRLLTAYGGAWGAWLGGWSPALWDPQGRVPDLQRAAGGALVGMGAGMLSGGIASQLLDLSLADVGELSLGSALSTVAGAGIGLMASPDDRALVGAMQGASLLGTALVGAFAKDTEYSWGDATLGALAGLYGLYQGAGIAFIGEPTDRQAAGAMMVGAAVGALAGMYLGPYVHLEPADVLMLSAGSAWGVWLGIWTTAAIQESFETNRDLVKLGVAATAIATDIAFTLTSVAISALVDMEPLRFAWISIFGGVGFLAGVTISELAFNSYAHGLLWGSVAGLTVGTIVTGIFDLPGMGMPKSQPTSEPVASLDDANLALHPLLPQVESWFPSVQVGPAGMPGDATEGQQVLFTVTGMFK